MWSLCGMLVGDAFVCGESWYMYGVCVVWAWRASVWASCCELCYNSGVCCHVTAVYGAYTPYFMLSVQCASIHATDGCVCWFWHGFTVCVWHMSGVCVLNIRHSCGPCVVL